MNYSAMIVDDEPLMRKYLGENLSKIASEWCVTGIARDGFQATELFHKQKFDLVITDIRMPEMDGLELAKYVCDTISQTKVVIISGFDDFEYAQRAIRCGVSDYLLKPLNDQDIANTLKKIAKDLQEERSRNNMLDHEVKAIKNNSDSNTLTERAKDYICAHYWEPISLALVAETLGVTASYLSDLFHKEIGESYSKFVTRIRMEHAVHMFNINPNTKIYEVAANTGFISAKHFNFVFKKFYGMTPTEFIHKNII